MDYADKISADFVATGHYAALRRSDHDVLPQLYAAKDDTKDQSYFLSNVAGSAFSKVLFPLGEMRKSQVREIALAKGLCTAEKKDSVGICFIGKRNFADFIHQYIPRQTGAFFTVDGERMHDHDGFTSYTIGQGARIQGMSEKWFVVGKRKHDHAVVIAPGTRHPALFTDALFASSSAFNWISGKLPKELLETGSSLRCQYRVRYRQELGECTVTLVSSANARAEASGLHDWDAPLTTTGDDVKTFMRVDFDRPQRGVTPQQALVLYRDDGLCYGGGPIAVAGRSYHEQHKPLAPDVYDWRSTL